jgi:hypothetical protein
MKKYGINDFHILSLLGILIDFFIYENDMIQNLKKYYNIDDHIDLLRFIKKNVTNTTH